jgi:hypothetical protein
MSVHQLVLRKEAIWQCRDYQQWDRELLPSLISPHVFAFDPSIAGVQRLVFHNAQRFPFGVAKDSVGPPLGLNPGDDKLVPRDRRDFSELRRSLMDQLNCPVMTRSLFAVNIPIVSE